MAEQDAIENLRARERELLGDDAVMFDTGAGLSGAAADFGSPAFGAGEPGLGGLDAADAAQFGADFPALPIDDDDAAGDFGAGPIGGGGGGHVEYAAANAISAPVVASQPHTPAIPTEDSYTKPNVQQQQELQQQLEKQQQAQNEKRQKLESQRKEYEKKWNEEQQEAIKKRDQEEKKKKEEIRQTAKTELDKFYEEYQVIKEKKISSSREQQTEKIALSGGVWQRVHEISERAKSAIEFMKAEDQQLTGGFEGFDTARLQSLMDELRSEKGGNDTIKLEQELESALCL